MLAALAAYSSLFVVAFVAATILPMQSEAVLVGLVMTSKFSTVGLVAVAAIGNTLGSIVNWFLGRGIERFQGSRWFPVSETGLERASRWYRRYGKWSLLLSWMPIFGDALTVVAGVLREPLLPFTILVSIAKTGRYIVLILATLQIAA
jgi:membrane protein YqaA with SNARE-associated domain